MSTSEMQMVASDVREEMGPRRSVTAGKGDCLPPSTTRLSLPFPSLSWDTDDIRVQPGTHSLGGGGGEQGQDAPPSQSESQGNVVTCAGPDRSQGYQGCEPRMTPVPKQETPV